MSAYTSASSPTHVPNTTFLQSLILREISAEPLSLTELRSRIFSSEFLPHVFDRAWYHTIDVMENSGWLTKFREGREKAVQITAIGRLELENYRAFCRLFTA